MKGAVLTDNGDRVVTLPDGSAKRYEGPDGDPFGRHSQYWEEGRSSLYNQAAITTGYVDQVATR